MQRRLSFVLFFLSTTVFVAMAQGTITGKTNPTAGTNSQYTLIDDVIYASPNWQVGSGTVISTSVTGVGPFTYKATVQFYGPPGTNSISFFSGASLVNILDVTVVCPAVNQPTASLSFNYACGSTTVSTASSPPGGETWYWQTSPIGTSTTYYSGLGFNVSTAGTYYLRSVSLSCWSTPQTFFVDVNAVPGVPSASNATFCGSGFLTATPGANGNAVNWYTTPTGGTAISGTNSPTVTTTTYFYVTSLNTTTGCETPTRTAKLATINAVPGPPTASNATFCGNGFLTATPGANANNINWYTSPTGGTGTTSLTSPNVIATTTFYMTSINTTSGCESSTRISVVASVNVVPGAASAANATFCGNGFLNAAPGANADNVNWYTTSSGGTGITSLNSPNVTATTTFYIASVNTATGCESAPRASFIATINVLPDAPAGSNQIFCGSGSILASPGANGNQVRWYSNANGGSPVVTSRSSPNVSATTTYYASTYNSSTGCESSRVSLTIGVDPVPTIAVTGTSNLTYGGGTNLSTYAGAFAYQWKMDGNNLAGAIQQGYSPLQAGNYTVAVKNNSGSPECTSAALVLGVGVQQAPVNSVSVTAIMKEGVTGSASLYTLQQKDLAQNIAYQDGLGQTFQSVGVGLSGTQTDVIGVASFGRNGLPDTVAFLPYATATKDGRFRLNTQRTASNQYIGSEQHQFYQNAPLVAHDAQPLARVVRRASPDARITEQGAPGADWQPGQHTVKNTFGLNTASTPVRLWKADGTTSGNCPLGTVTVATTTDENGYLVRTFTNALGQTVLKQVQVAGTAAAPQWLQTYYIFDNYGRLIYQLPPRAMQVLGAGASLNAANASVAELVYKYTYDIRGRLTQKKEPGAIVKYFVYDNLDRAVLTQDGNLRASKKWYFTKFDAYGRVAYTGTYTNTTQTTLAAVQALFDGLDYTTQPFFETMAAGGSMQGYTNTVFPTANLIVLAANYYDTYDFDQNGSDDFTYNPAHMAGLPAITNIGNMLRGLPTGSTKLVVGSTTWLKSAVFYDQYDRVAQTQGYHHLNTATPSTSSIAYADLAGHVANTKQTHSGPGGTSVVVEQRYDYDPNWRTTAIYHKTNGGTEYQVAGYTYNVLGQLVDKKLHVVNGTPLQSVDLRYHLRGWLASINNAQLANDGGITNDDPTGPADLFGVELAYNTSAGMGNTPLYNGNLTAVKWKGPGLSASAADQRSFTYTYDKSERLLTTTFAANSGSGWTKEANTLNESITYDLNGNISTLVRNQNQRGLTGTTVTSTAQAVDNLSYTYTSNTNRLLKVEDAALATGFNNGAVNGAAEYTYNTDGSLTKDDNKGIASISYNILGKPQVVTYTGTPSKTVTYTYDAAGAKLKTVTVANNVTTTTDYVGGFVYTNNTLSFFSSPEGRVVKNGSSFEYQYAIADHQGNTRVLFTSATPYNTPFNATFEGDATDWTSTFTNVNLGKIGPGGSAANSGTKVIRMDASYKVGPTRSVHVYPGDKIDMEVWEYHEANSGYGTSSTAIGTLITAVASSIGGVNGGAGEAGLKYSGVNTAFVNFGTGGNQGDGRPAAYLNFILFDKDYKVLSAGWQLAPAATFTKQLISFQTKNITVEGYLVAWLSYDDDNNWVYFDDFKITHTKNNVVQYNEYYAHGLPTANSWTRENAKENNFLGNGGTEFNATTALYDLDFRNFDPVLGRMHQVDPMASKYGSLTPYNYSFNMPNMVVDVNGADPADNGGRDPANYWFEESMQRRAAQGKGEPQSNTFNYFDRLFGPSQMMQQFRTVGGYGGMIRDPGIFKDGGWAQIGGTVNDMYQNTNPFDGASFWTPGSDPIYFVGNGRGQLQVAGGGSIAPVWTYNYKDYSGVKGPSYNWRLTGFVWLSGPKTQSPPQTWYYMSRNGTPHGMVYDPVGGFIYEVNQVPGQSKLQQIEGLILNSVPSNNAKVKISVAYQYKQGSAEWSSLWEREAGNSFLLSPVTVPDPAAATAWFKGQTGCAWNYSIGADNCAHYSVIGLNVGGAGLNYTGPLTAYWPIMGLNSLGFPIAPTMTWTAGQAHPVLIGK